MTSQTGYHTGHLCVVPVTDQLNIYCLQKHLSLPVPVQNKMNTYINSIICSLVTISLYIIFFLR